MQNIEKSSKALMASKVPGRPPLPKGVAKAVRASLRTTPERMAKADRLAAAAGLSRNEWLEALIDAAPDAASHGASQPGPTTRLPDPVLVGLTYAQLAFMREVSDSREGVANYLRRGVLVQVVANNEVPEAPPFALDVVENPSFWIGCFDSEAQAVETAMNLGLRVAPCETSKHS